MMIVAPLSVTPERSVAVDFVEPFLEDGTGILLSKPKDAPEFFKIFRPLHFQ